MVFFRNLFAVILALMAFACLCFGQVIGETPVMTDFEGRIEALTAQINGGSLTELGGKLELPKNVNQIVFNGDLLDRGPSGMKLLQMFLDLKARYPQVKFVWGNRDVGKLRFLGGLYKIRSLENTDYVQFLLQVLGKTSLSEVKLENLKQINTPDRQIEFWAKENGMEKAVEFHRMEMASNSGSPVELRDARLDYFDLLTNPNREYLKFIRQGQMAYIDGRILYLHGGIPGYSGFVPGMTNRLSRPTTWIPALNKMGHEGLELLIRQANTPKSEVVERFLNYIDAVWVPEYQTTVGHENSVIYGVKYKEGGSYVLPPQKQLEWYKQDVDLIVTGHNPVGDYPVLMQARELGLFLLMADNSYSQVGLQSMIRVSQAGVEIRGQISTGQAVQTSIRFDEPTEIGLQDENGRIQIGVVLEQSASKVEWKLENRRASYVLGDPKGALRSPYVRVNSELEEQKGYLRATMKKFNSTELAPEDVASYYRGRLPILISGASSFNDDGSAEIWVRELIEEIIIHLKTDKVYFQTGGTESGTVERILQEIAAEYGIPVHANLVGSANPSAVSSRLKTYSIVGDRWAEQIPASLKSLKQAGGFAIFVGGGPMVRDGIMQASQMDVPAYLAASIAGASQDLAPGRSGSFSTSDQLLNLLGKDHSEIIRPFYAKLTPSHQSDPRIYEISADSVLRWFKASGRKVITLSGFSGMGYTDEVGLRATIERDLQGLDPKKYLINIGATEVGIGLGYQIAKEKGFVTTGVVSAKALKYGGLSPYCDYIFAIKDESWGGYKIPGKMLSVVSKVMLYVSDAYYAYGGGDVALQEFEASALLGKANQFYPFDSNLKKATEQAAKKGLPPPSNLKGALEKSLLIDRDRKGLPMVIKAKSCEGVFSR